MIFRGKCPNKSELAQAHSGKPDKRLQAHLKNCPKCAAVYEDDAQLIELGKKLQSPLPTDERLKKMKLELTKEAVAFQAKSNQPRSYTKAFALAATLAAVFLLAFIYSIVLNQSQNVEVENIYRASITPVGMATYSVESAQPNEIVRLLEGTIKVKVDPLRSGERFRIMLGDADIEVKGTVFNVEAKNNALVDVRVFSGKVEVRRLTEVPLVLASRESWASRRPSGDIDEKKVTVVKVAEAAPAAVPPNAISPRVSSLPREPRNIERTPVAQKSLSSDQTPLENDVQREHFEKGWRALRAGRYSEAVEAFAQAAKLGQQTPMTEDVAFWHAVALKYSGQTDRAQAMLLDFTKVHPSSPHVNEASVILGWLLFDKGDYKQAGYFFNSAIDAPVPRIRDSAVKGLAKIETRENE